MQRKLRLFLKILAITLPVLLGCNPETPADMILVNGKVIAVDKDFTIYEALAVKSDTIMKVGSNDEIRKLAGRETILIDAGGRAVIPGIIDAHLHPEGASISELGHAIPDIQSIGELLEWISAQTRLIEKGEWIIHPKLFLTRLVDMRLPTLEELDSIAPDHPVFLNGSYAGMINSEAMRLSGISRETHHEGVIKASAFNLLRIPPKKKLSNEERIEALGAMFLRYHRYGITSLCAGAGTETSFRMYQELSNKNLLTMRILQNIVFRANRGNIKETLETLKNNGIVTGYGDQWVRVGALKVFLDGGILTGTAYLEEPWGKRASDVFKIEDPGYRGEINYSRSELLPLVRAAGEYNWKFTAHCTGGGAVDLLLDVYEEVNKTNPIINKRFSIIHGNFFSDRNIRRMKELGVYADIQPAWFYKDADAMEYILGQERIREFHPYRSLVQGGVMMNGGSDHMVGFDANSSINPYNPFLAMWTMVSRTTERGSRIKPSEAISRIEALRIYTINNAYASFEEAEKGSLEPGKLADMAILSENLLTCPVDQIRNIYSELTIVGGKIVYSSGKVEHIKPYDHE